MFLSIFDFQIGPLILFDLLEIIERYGQRTISNSSPLLLWMVERFIPFCWLKSFVKKSSPVQILKEWSNWFLYQLKTLFRLKSLLINSISTISESWNKFEFKSESWIIEVDLKFIRSSLTMFKKPFSLSSWDQEMHLLIKISKLQLIPVSYTHLTLPTNASV